MGNASSYPTVMRLECRACGREFEATGRARMSRDYCDEHCRRWANTETGKRILAERETPDPPIPEDVYRRFPILGQMAETAGDALAAWLNDCDCNRCKILRAAHPVPVTAPARKARRRPKINLALGPRYPCGHPRTVANSYATTAGSAGCYACFAAATHARRHPEGMS